MEDAPSIVYLSAFLKSKVFQTDSACKGNAESSGNFFYFQAFLTPFPRFEMFCVGTGTVSRNGKELFLSALEYRLLVVFAHHKGRFADTGPVVGGKGCFRRIVNDNALTVYIIRF